ncbi:HPr family phosphocarrier protein [Lentisphaera profundi]|uniref:HPr family phosphocarrier protein n=1 Tax=Lentisphaera profundi TaxID=1658616 RepID=A0ABY7VUS8_9BACT|nr:HPr family phosphocarrier protein [Lentisphaera profundi]WDE96581.1 HPr family phosphocarrier protein [Lentisphaera profundi]
MNRQIKVTVSNEYGLHARPAAMIVRALGSFKSEVLLKTDSEEANCRNILDLMSLAAACGQELDVQANGPDSEDAINKIKDLFESKFGE